MKFVDLFAGLGGFHIALKKLGHDCVFACEIEENLRQHYLENFNIYPDGDITKIKLKSIPKHDILCAGFPCQPFSKAGFANGFSHKIAGKMFFHLFKIIKYHKPQYLFLENVPNLLSHDRGKTWKFMRKEIKKLGYEIDQKIISPIDFNIPQTRDRLYIVARQKKLKNFKWPEKINSIPNLKNFLISNPKNIRKLTDNKKKLFNFWKKFLTKVPKKGYIPNPLWTMEFGATYPFEKATPHSTKINALRKLKGSFGKNLQHKSKDEIFNSIPKYARGKFKKFPGWKIRMIKRSRDFYLKNKSWVDKLIPEILNLEFEAYQKLEWNCQGEKFNLTKKIVSFRGSGVRIKRSISSPTLIASSQTQIPYLPWKNRYLAHEECINIQGFKGIKSFPEASDKFYCTIGNAVNVGVVSRIAKNLFNLKNVSKR